MISESIIIEEYESGLSINKICKKYNLTYSYVRYRVFKSGKTRQRYYVNEPQKDQRFGMLVYKETIRKKGFHKKWRCKCDCGNFKEAYPSQLRDGVVQSCGCSTYRIVSDHQFKGYKDISLTYFNQIKNNAISRNLEFNITIEYIWDLFIQQNRKCVLTGICLSLKDRKRNREKNASLDRIDPFKGYVVDNVQWVHQVVNSCKFVLNNEQFFTMCKMVVENNSDRIKEDISFKDIKYSNRHLGKLRYKTNG